MATNTVNIGKGYASGMMLTAAAGTSLPATLTLAAIGSWGTEVAINDEWQEIRLRSGDFTPDRTPQLPQDWPGFGPYYRPDFGGTEAYIHWAEVENLYFSLRAEDFEDQGASPKGIEIEWVKVQIDD